MSKGEIAFLILKIVATLLWIRVVVNSESHVGDDNEKESKEE